MNKIIKKKLEHLGANGILRPKHDLPHLAEGLCSLLEEPEQPSGNGTAGGPGFFSASPTLKTSRIGVFVVFPMFCQAFRKVLMAF